jgi:SAM-dependent methyltransferase
MSRVLLIGPRQQDLRSPSAWPHLGLAILATILEQGGHKTRVVDYAYSPDSPSPVSLVESFKPDVVGVSLYTQFATLACSLIKEIRKVKDIPIIVGGPHATLYHEMLLENPDIGCVVRGEAEGVINELVSNACTGSLPRLVEPPRPEMDEVPMPKFHMCDGYERMISFPMQMSRGCPFNCVFCEVHKLSGRWMRYRDIDRCIQDIKQAKRDLPYLRELRIVDDCPMAHVGRFKRFLHQYIQEDLGLDMFIDNVRADQIDEEMVELLWRCRLHHICIGVESGNRIVFQEIQKGERLQDIERCARIVKRQGIRLDACFVIGLPFSTYERELDSLRLAKRLKLTHIFWNMFVPYRGTRAREWFERHGTLLGELDAGSLIDNNLRFSRPSCEAPEFPVKERERFWVRATLETASFDFRPALIPRIIGLLIRYRIPLSVFPMVKSLLLKLPRKALWIWRRDRIFRELIPKYPTIPTVAFVRAHEARIHKNLPLDPPLLDLGCGNGVFMGSLLRRGAFTGCDLSSQVLKQASRLGVYKLLINASAEDLPYRTGCFQTVFSNCTLEHVGKIDKALAEISRVLCPGGLLIFSVPTSKFKTWFFPGWFLRLLGLRGPGLKALECYNREEQHHNLLSIEEWQVKLKWAGFKIKSIHPYLSATATAVFSLLDWLWHLRPFGGRYRHVAPMAALVYRLTRYSWLKKILCTMWIAILNPFYIISAKGHDFSAAIIRAEKVGKDTG